MRARKSHEEWSAIVELFERSGMTHEQFCKKHGLKVKSFRWWLYRLREIAAQKRVELLPVALVAGGERGTTAEVIESSPSARER